MSQINIIYKTSIKTKQKIRVLLHKGKPVELRKSKDHLATYIIFWESGQLFWSHAKCYMLCSSLKPSPSLAYTCFASSAINLLSACCFRGGRKRKTMKLSRDLSNLVVFTNSVASQECLTDGKSLIIQHVHKPTLTLLFPRLVSFTSVETFPHG